MSSWENKVLKVMSEYKNKEGVLKHRWEIVQPTNGDKHFAPTIQKTSYYLKDGVETRGYPQGLSKYDMNWLSEHWQEAMALLSPGPAKTEASKPASEAVAATMEEVEETPF